MELSADYEAGAAGTERKSRRYRKRSFPKSQEATVNAEKFMNVVRRHTSFEELTPTLLAGV